MSEALRSSLKPIVRSVTLFLALLHTVIAVVLLGVLFVYPIDPRWKDLIPLAIGGGFGAMMFFWFLYFATLDE